MNSNVNTIDTIAGLIERMESETGTVALKINHGTWERLAQAKFEMPFPARDDFESRKQLEALYAGSVDRADQVSGFFTTGFMDDFLIGLKNIDADDHAFHCGVSTDAFEDDNRFFPTQRASGADQAMRMWAPPECRQDMDPLLFKTMAEDGTYPELFEYLKDDWVVCVGPSFCAGFMDFARLPHGRFVEIDRDSIPIREQYEPMLIDAIKAGLGTGRKITVIHQASILGNLWTFRLRPTFPEVRWLDFGLAMSLCNPDEDIFKRPWGVLAGDRIAEHLNHWLGRQAYRPLPSNPDIDKFFSGERFDVAKPHQARPEHWRPNRERYADVLASPDCHEHATSLLIETLRTIFEIPQSAAILPLGDTETARSVASNNNPQGNPLQIEPVDSISLKIDKHIDQFTKSGRSLIIEGPARRGAPWSKATWVISFGPVLENETQLTVVVIDKTKLSNQVDTYGDAGTEDILLALDWLGEWEFRSARLDRQRRRLVALSRKAGLSPTPPKLLIDSLAHGVAVSLSHAPGVWPDGKVAELFTLMKTQDGKHILWIDARPRAANYTADDIFSALVGIAAKAV